MQNKSSDVTKPPYLVESVDLSLQVLLLLRDRRRLRVTDVAAEFGVAKSTAHRILMTLAWRGFVAQERDGKAYRAGQTLYEIGLGVSAGLDVVKAARPHIGALAESCRETVNLVVLEGPNCRFVDGVEGAHQLRIGLRTGTILPAYAVSGGKALLAELDPEEVRGMFSTSFEELTHRTIRDVDALLHELEQVRRLGYALNLQESEDGVGAIGMRIVGPHSGVVAALAVAIPAIRMTPQRVSELLDEIRATASEISEDLYQ